MFGKKKTSEFNILALNVDWSKDFEPLNFVMQRKKNITKNYVINVITTQKEKDTYLNDNELEPVIENSVMETVNVLDGVYKQFLITKYFGSEDNLITFIAEDYYVDLTAYAINKNTEKIKKVMTDKVVKNISELNNRINNKNN